jgi:hypothetical protein
VQSKCATRHRVQAAWAGSTRSRLTADCCCARRPKKHGVFLDAERQVTCSTAQASCARASLPCRCSASRPPTTAEGRRSTDPSAYDDVEPQDATYTTTSIAQRYRNASALLFLGLPPTSNERRRTPPSASGRNSKPVTGVVLRARVVSCMIFRPKCSLAEPRRASADPRASAPWEGNVG